VRLLFLPSFSTFEVPFHRPRTDDPSRSYLPSFLQEAGYATYYTGKLMNGHTTGNVESLEAEGWTDHAFLLDPNTYDYWNPAFSTGNSGKGVEYRPGEYSTDLVAEKALDLLEKASKQDKPFFLGSALFSFFLSHSPQYWRLPPAVAPIAPHSHISAAGHSDRTIPMLFDIPKPHPRHAHLFKDVTLNKSRVSFNPDVPSGASWVYELEKLNETNVDYIEEFYRGRLQSLQAVDELVEGVVQRLEELGKLDNTIIIYTAYARFLSFPPSPFPPSFPSSSSPFPSSFRPVFFPPPVLTFPPSSHRDNGFEANAGHRRQPGKTLPYEEDINVPLIVRSPFTPRGVVDSTSVYTLADLGATILKLAGAEADYEHDGAIVPITRELRKEAEEQGGTQQQILVSYWVEGVGEGLYGSAFPLSFFLPLPFLPPPIVLSRRWS